MAYEIAGQRITVPWGTTTAATTANDMRMYIMSGANAILPDTTSFIRPFGILTDRPPSTASGGAFMINGVAKIVAEASTLAAGDQFSCSTAGRATTVSTGFLRLGHVLDGSSGAVDRVLTVLFQPWGTT